MSQQDVVTAETQTWVFDTPPLNIRGSKMQLLTIGKVSVMGKWSGTLGQYFVAWAPLLKIPKDAPKIYNGTR